MKEAQLKQTGLMRFLEKKNDHEYFAKVIELREAVRGWLGYIPATFGHYTSHSIDHSDEIVYQLSQLLFKPGKRAPKPVIDLSPVEAYVLCAAAYLHDTGMVVSEKEKAEIVGSDAWKAWTAAGAPGAERWQEIERFRNGTKPEDGAKRDFLADLQQRWLIAEFVRRSHHTRAAHVIHRYEPFLANFSFGDKELLRVIEVVCVAHGLKQHELQDSERFPEDEDIKHEHVNTRFMAMLFRIGDLLDLSYDRACPLLLNAASPLPPESIAHWGQYRNLKRPLVSPDSVSIKATCDTQEEHRLLYDWCSWLVDENRNTGVAMTHAERHRGWAPPRISFAGDPNHPGREDTIVIKPARSAKYFFTKWKFELDNEAVIDRLVNDVYRHPIDFIRELMQNALDANRCQMYADLVAANLPTPERPTAVDEEWRGRYPVHVSLRTEQVRNELSGQQEERQVVVVEDCGIGMDDEIISKYLLQIGRSYYRTDEFRRSFRFNPTSRFGVGFLSVFAASDHVVIDTCKPSSMSRHNRCRLTLTRPTSYLLTENGTRSAHGTTVAVRLRSPLEQGRLAKLVSYWCKRVEFPVRVDELGEQRTITAERPADFTREVPVVGRDGARLAIKAFPIDHEGVVGEIYVLAYVDRNVESWSCRYSLERGYEQTRPGAIVPALPSGLCALHGITIEKGLYSFGRCRMDYRGDARVSTLERRWYFTIGWASDMDVFDAALRHTSEQVFREHLEQSPLATGPDGWRYKLELANTYGGACSWADVSGTIPILSPAGTDCVSLSELLSLPSFFLVSPKPDASKLSDPPGAVISHANMAEWPVSFTSEMMRTREVRAVRRLNANTLAFELVRCQERDTEDCVQIFDLPDARLIGYSIFGGRGASAHLTLLNATHPFVKWVQEIESNGEHSVLAGGNMVTQLRQRLLEACANSYALKELAEYVRNWSSVPGMPTELMPPDVQLASGSFERYWPRADKVGPGGQ